MLSTRRALAGAFSVIVKKPMDRLQLNTKEEGEGDPYLAEYSRMSAPIVKLMLRSLASASQMVKMHVIRQWVAANTLYHVQVRTRDNTCDNQQDFHLINQLSRFEAV